ncbi:MAG: hypothetical protein ACLU4N_10950 [Butyricimonas faecihominis]
MLTGNPSGRDRGPNGGDSSDGSGSDGVVSSIVVPADIRDLTFTFVGYKRPLFGRTG